MSAHDRYLAAYSTHLTTAWCGNRACPNSQDGITVRYETEYGFGTITPEECPDCHEALQNEPPPPEEEDDDDA